MKQKKVIAASLLSLSLVYVFACQSKPKMAEEPSWGQNMRGLASHLVQLVPYVYSSQKYRDPANHQFIQDRLIAFAALSHSIAPEKQLRAIDEDPTLELTARELDAMLSQALKTFEKEQKEYSRHVIKAALGQCFQCHTRNRMGPELDSSFLTESQLSQLQPVERADLLTAIRDYDRSLETLTEFMRSADLGLMAIDMEEAIFRYMTVSIRVKKNPELALSGLSMLLKRQDLPIYLKNDAQVWKKSLEEWKVEPKDSTTNLLHQAKALIVRARKLQKYSYDSAGMVQYQRASSLLHDFLRASQDIEQTAEGLYLLGESYKAMRDLEKSYLSESYYEACIHQAPHSKIAGLCYERWEESIYVGYSGSMGTFIPELMLEKMNRLKELSRRKL